MHIYLEDGPPEKATRTLSAGVIKALEVTASRNFPYRLLRKQSKQNFPSSPAPHMGSLALHLTHKFGSLESLLVSVGGFECCSRSTSFLKQPDWQLDELHAIAAAIRCVLPFQSF